MSAECADPNCPNRREALLWRQRLQGAMSSHRCIACGHEYTPVGESEDCPACGCDGTAPPKAADSP